MCRNRNCENFNAESALHDYCGKCIKMAEAVINGNDNHLIELVDKGGNQ